MGVNGVRVMGEVELANNHSRIAERSYVLPSGSITGSGG